MPKTQPPADELTLRDALAWYREAVERVAGGLRLTGEECVRVDVALAVLSLPAYAWGRDVAATRRYLELDDGYLRDELLVVHPHVFLPLDQAARLWEDARRRRVIRRQRQTT